MSIRRWRYSSSSSSSVCSWHTPWGNHTSLFIIHLLLLESHWDRQRLTMNLVSPLDSVSVMKPTDSRWSTTAWRSFGCGTESQQESREENPSDVTPETLRYLFLRLRGEVRMGQQDINITTRLGSWTSTDAVRTHLEDNWRQISGSEGSVTSSVAAADGADVLGVHQIQFFENQSLK